ARGLMRFIEGVPIYLNVYDLTPMNGYVYWAGLGIFHSGVEVHGVEYAFGAHDYPTSGVFEVEPCQCPGFTFRKSVFIGSTTLSPAELREFIEQHAGNYNGDTYHLIAKNWSLCNCLLPEGLHVSVVRHQPDYQAYEGEKKRLRSSFCRLSGSLSAMSTKQRQLSVSSVFLTHP
ncbi:hypothetical protein KI387_012399, partial [Taxus chinensis]